MERPPRPPSSRASLDLGDGWFYPGSPPHGSSHSNGIVPRLSLEASSAQDLEDGGSSQRPRRWANDVANSVPWPASWNSNVDWQSRAAVSDDRRMSRTLRVSTPRSRRSHRRPVSSAAVARERQSNAQRQAGSAPRHPSDFVPHTSSSYVSLPAGSLLHASSFEAPSPGGEPQLLHIADSLGLPWRPKTSDSTSSLTTALIADGSPQPGDLSEEDDLLLYGGSVHPVPERTQGAGYDALVQSWSPDVHKHLSLAPLDVPKLEPRPAQGSSFAQTMFNATNVLAGVGLLAMPYAIATAGSLGLVLLVVYSALCAYTGCLLRRCMDAYDGVRSYPDIGWVAFGATGRAVIGVILYAELFMMGCEFLILVGDSVAAMVPHPETLPFLGWAAGMEAETFWLMVGCAAITPTMYMRDLSLLSYVSAAGVVSTVAVALLVLTQAASEGGGPHWGDFRPLKLGGLPMATGMYAFCYSGHAMFPSLYISMKDRSQYTSVLIASIVAVTVGYVAVAVVGYGLYGPDVGNNIVVQMKLEDPAGICATVASLLTILTPVAKFALTLLPVAEAMEELLPVSLSHRDYAAASGLMRTCLVALCAATALSLPFFADVAAIIGSLLSVSISIILPTLCYISISRGSVPWPQLVFPAVCCGVGVCCAAIGTYTSVSQVIQKL